jgi:hypothetical protein
MKNILFLLMLLSLSTAYALEGKAEHHAPVSCVFKVYSPPAAGTENLETLKAQMAKYKGFKTGGIAMMSGGAGLFVVGEVMLFTSLALNLSGQRNYQNSRQDPLWDGGLACTLVGVGSLAGGVPLYIIGNKKIKKLRRKIDSLNDGK